MPKNESFGCMLPYMKRYTFICLFDCLHENGLLHQSEKRPWRSRRQDAEAAHPWSKCGRNAGSSSLRADTNAIHIQ